jgi:hypothetical protein
MAAFFGFGQSVCTALVSSLTMAPVQENDSKRTSMSG